MSSSERYDLSHRIAREKGVYMINSNSPMRTEGSKTFSFEVWQDLELRVPDWVVIPTSSGGNTRSIWKGFKELQTVGLANELPHLLLAQAAGCAPIVKAFREGKEDVDIWLKVESIASSVNNTNPPGGREVLRIIKESKGYAEDATDEQIERATIDFAAKEGVFCEPSSATALAALGKAVGKGLIQTDDIVVLDVTGAGFKDLGVANKVFSSPRIFAGV
jgi:threonine synthase